MPNSQELTLRINQASDEAAGMLTAARGYAETEVERIDGRPLQSYLDAGEVLVARDRYVELMEASVASFLASAKNFAAAREILDIEVDQACGINGGALVALDLIYNARDAGEIQAKVQAVAGQYAHQIDALHAEIETACAKLQHEQSMHLENFKNFVAQTHNIAIDVLDTTLIAAKAAGGTVALVAGVGAAAVVATVFVTAVVVVEVPLWIAWSIGTSATDYLRRLAR